MSDSKTTLKTLRIVANILRNLTPGMPYSIIGTSVHVTRYTVPTDNGVETYEYFIDETENCGTSALRAAQAVLRHPHCIAG